LEHFFFGEVDNNMKTEKEITIRVIRARTQEIVEAVEKLRKNQILKKMTVLLLHLEQRQTITKLYQTF
tara:strand:+ start:956 stop:1159 length:204 start_codon:yes stop_codon:yes gene_type:complete